MAHKSSYRVKERRRREGRTDKAKRLALLKSGKPRLVARALSKTIIAQIIKYNPKGDETLVNTTSLELKKIGYNESTGNSKAAYLTGYLCGKKAISKGIKEAVLDIGLRTPVHGSNIFAVLKGAIDAGMLIPHSEEALPKEERIIDEKVKKVLEEINRKKE